MRRLLALILVISLWFGVSPAASADVARLVPCGDVPAFNERLNTEIQGFEGRLEKYSSDSAPAAMLKKDINKAEARFEHYSGFLCGPDGLPRLIVDGRLGHIGEFLLPGLAFLYIAGWIGYSGRSYLRKVKDSKEPELMEIQPDLPLFLQCFVSGLLWPLASIQEMLSGDLINQEGEIPVSPR